MLMRLVLACSLAVATSATSAFAAAKPPACSGAKKTVVHCRHHGGPEGPAVEIVQCKNGEEIASIYMPGPGGKPHLDRAIVVKQKALDPHKMGAPKVWTGTSFELSANFTTAPLASSGGMHLGKLKSGSVHDEVACSQQ